MSNEIMRAGGGWRWLEVVGTDRVDADSLLAAGVLSSPHTPSHRRHRAEDLHTDVVIRPPRCHRAE